MFNLTAKDKYLILATDGLWDELNRKDSATIATKLKTNGPENEILKKLPFTF